MWHTPHASVRDWQYSRITVKRFAREPQPPTATPAAAHISMKGTRGEIRTVIVEIRGWKEAESRPRSWR
jgi:hypothetical protein